jgi:hypothetical protein
MAAELVRFLAGSLALLLPGIFLARWLRLGKTSLEQSAYGSTLGLAMAVYLASLASHFNLKWFYPAWGGVGIVCLIGWWTSGRTSSSGQNADAHWERWLAVILLVVGISRYCVVLPEQLPDGWDPAFHMILARKIQLAQHAIYDWKPFADVSLNYPIGSHLLIVVLSAMTRLPLHTVFKDLIPLLGVLSTAQVYLLARRVAASAQVGFYSAAIYGVCAWGGSIDYFRWGGLPNQLAMLLFLPVLSLWLDDESFGGGAFPAPGALGEGTGVRVVIMAVLYAAVVLVHHHVMVVSGAILLVAMICQMIRPSGAASWKSLALALVLTAALDGFYLIPYAAKIGTLPSTRMVQLSERVLDLGEIPQSIGYAMCLLSAAGLVLWVRGRVRCHPLALWGVLTLAAMFIGCEYVYPLIRRAQGLAASTIFTPSRFLSDANYFLVIFAGLPAALVQNRRRLPTFLILLFLMVAGLTLLPQWLDAPVGQSAAPTDSFVGACHWIADNTSPSTIVVNLDQPMNTKSWAPYLTWRRCAYTPIPASEPVLDMNAIINHANQIMLGQIPPDAPDMRIVRLISVDKEHLGQVLWFDAQGGLVVQLWPRITGNGKQP